MFEGRIFIWKKKKECMYKIEPKKSQHTEVPTIILFCWSFLVYPCFVYLKIPFEMWNNLGISWLSIGMKQFALWAGIFFTERIVTLRRNNTFWCFNNKRLDILAYFCLKWSFTYFFTFNVQWEFHNSQRRNKKQILLLLYCNLFCAYIYQSNVDFFPFVV